MSFPLEEVLDTGHPGLWRLLLANPIAGLDDTSGAIKPQGLAGLAQW